MFNNVVLDVFIGLVLVYLLYSLLMTIVSEMLATWMNLRPRILRASIEKMLNDGYFPPKIRPRNVFSWIGSWIVDLWMIIQRFFLREFKDFKFSFAARFYEVPSVKYLTSRAGEPRTFFTQTKPSYISADNFADSLYRLLKDGGSGATDMDKINFSLKFNSQNVQTGSLRQLRDLAENSGSNGQLFREKLKAWYNETQDRATGWYKRKIRILLFWLGFIVAAIFNINSIGIAKILAKDKEARAQLVSMGIEMAKDSLRYKDFVTDNGDSVVYPKQVIDSGYARISKDIREANLVLGLGWGTDELRKSHTYKIGASDENYAVIGAAIRDSQYIKLRDAFVRQGSRHQGDIDSIATMQQLLNQYKIDSFLNVDQRPALSVKADSARIILQRLAVQKTNDSTGLRILFKDIEAIHKTANTVSDNAFTSIQSVRFIKGNDGAIEVSGSRGYYWNEKFCFVFNKVITLNGFWGFVITGLMISLGAPFWFDLLKKLVALRGAGVKPEEKKEKNAVDPVLEAVVEEERAVQAQVLSDEQKVTAALEKLTQRSKDEAGIVAIAIEYRQDTGAPYLVMMAENDELKSFLQKKYGAQERLDNEFAIPIEYTLDSKIDLHIAMAGSEISNEKKVLGSGTLGCHMKKKGSKDLYFISCWHVMKDNSSWDTAPVHTSIICKDKTRPIGRIENGFLSHHPHTGLDIGIAKYNKPGDALPNADFVIKAQHRQVTALDFALSTPVKLFGKVSGLRSATIFHNKINARVKYPDGNTYLMNDVFSITSKNEQGRKIPPTTQGDSGAIVIDENGVPLGMIIGGSGNFSYAIKFSNLFDEGKPFKDYFFNV